MAEILRVEQANFEISRIARDAALAEGMAKERRDKGLMDKPLATKTPLGKTFEPSEVKTVRVPR